ncbi:MAG: hypothetical protein YHS30scaffold667_33 [Phage 65_10]|nr:MAG: hypothetical protein YHS30scaffold667_33 [Phage 65_10]
MIPRETAAALKKTIRQGLDGLRAQEPIPLSQWAGENFVLAGDSSHQKGKWEAWEFQLGLLDFMSDQRIEEFNLAKSKRVGYSKMLVAYVMYCIAHRRRKVALWQPTDDDRDSFVKTEIDPALALIPAVAAARKSFGDAKDTMAYKAFRDSVLHVLGGKAARAYRRITVDDAILDEWDGFDAKVEKSSDPRTLAKGRLEGAPYPKFIGGTTPRIKGLSLVELACAESDVMMRFNIECKHCGVEHPLIFGGTKVKHGLKWDKDADGAPINVRHVCPHCLESITQADYLANMKGTWVCERTGKRYGADRTWRDNRGEPCATPRHVAAHVWSAYSPQRSWLSIGRERIAAARSMAAGNDGQMQGFVNETLGETYELTGARSDEHALLRRAKNESFELKTVPVGALQLTSAVDTQDDRLEYAVWGWGEGMESWLVDKGIVWGSPAEDNTWAMLAVALQQGYVKEWDGAIMHTSGVAVDVQGHHTHAAYNFVRPRQAQGYYAIRGGNRDDLPIVGKATSVDVTWQGKTHKAGVRLWEVGTSTAKDLLHSQLQLAAPGPGFVHLPKDVGLEACEQLTAEHRILVNTGAGAKFRWMKRRPRNEQLDMRNYAAFVAQSLRMHLRDEKAWAKFRARIEPKKVVQADGTLAPQVVIEAPRRPPPRKTAAPVSQRDW